MNRKIEISNLRDFDQYRSICPFCSNTLKLICKNSIISNSIPAFSPITIKEDANHYILTYEGLSAFCTLINSYLKRIIINKDTNDIIYEEQLNLPFPAEHLTSALSGNIITISKQCDCIYEYILISQAIDLSSLHNVSCNPAIFSESFCIDHQEQNSFAKITIHHSFNKTRLSCFDLSNKKFSKTYDEYLPFIHLPWNDIDAILSKVRLLLTFS